MSEKIEGGAKNTRGAISLQQKIEILDNLKNGYINKKVAEIFSIHPSTVCAIKKNEEKLRELHASGLNSKIKKFRESLPEIERALYQRYLNAFARSIPITNQILKTKAYHFAKLTDKNISISDGWISRWKAKHNLVSKIDHGEKKDADLQSSQNWVKSILPNILKEYKAEDIFNCDESGLFFLLSPK